MPLIYYIEGHTLHFGRPEFSLITDFRFGTVSFGLHTSGELKFRNRVFSHKTRLIITNLDVIGVIEDEETFGKLSDEDAVRLCLLLALEGEHLWTHLYNEIKNSKVKHSDEHYYGLKKDHNYVSTYTFSGFVFAFQIWILDSFERYDKGTGKAIMKDKKQKLTGIKEVDELEQRIKNVDKSFLNFRDKKLKQKEMIFISDDDTSSNDDTSKDSHDYLSENSFFDEMCMEQEEVVFKIHTKGHFQYDPLREKKTKKGAHKGNEKVFEDEGMCSKESKPVVTIYKRALVNGKVKMVEEVGVVKTGRDIGVVIIEAEFNNVRGKEEVVESK
uniref:Phospholipase-like protein n=1 Tax=Tanacetum cinerariifolium TaxID=118510 RepID=A0A6L2J5E3_TANCI|nr:phospholipase-like protein [Tanacetum cinerariifolium]